MEFPGRKSISVEGGINEEPEFLLIVNEQVPERDIGWCSKPCGHWIPMKEEDAEEEDGNRNGYFPRIVVAINEGGHNSTSVCLDCLLERVKENKEFLGL